MGIGLTSGVMGLLTGPHLEARVSKKSHNRKQTAEREGGKRGERMKREKKKEKEERCIPDVLL